MQGCAIQIFLRSRKTAQECDKYAYLSVYYKVNSWNAGKEHDTLMCLPFSQASLSMSLSHFIHFTPCIEKRNFLGTFSQDRQKRVSVCS
jgi:hypothetical protein